MMEAIKADRQESLALHAQSNKIKRIYYSQQDYFAAGHTRSYAFRKASLIKLWDAIKANEAKIVEAVYKDFRKSEFEVYGTEIGPVYSEFRHILSGLRRLMKPKKVSTPLPFFPSKSWIYREPLGNTLIISPWNYPFTLLMRPLISAIAGGNTVILKPSEIAPHTADLIAQIITENFDESYIAVIEGNGEQIGKELMMNYHFDHVFFYWFCGSR